MPITQSDTACKPFHRASIEIKALQEIARSGRLRIRAFGDERFFGIETTSGLDLETAAERLPEMMASGIAAVYRDSDGYFIGPKNPDCIGGVADPQFQPVRGTA